MNDSKHHFIEKLADTQLLSESEMQEVRSLADELEEGVEEFSETLVRRHTLTEYQAKAIFAGEHENLVFGEYVVTNELGQGGMGVVLAGRHRTMDREVAIKFLPQEALKHADAVPRFQKEVKAAAKLSHPNIVQAYDAGEHSGMHFLVMELVDGEDLADRIKRDGPLSEAMAIHYSLQAAKGLSYAHQQGLIHRDIKPRNLLVDKTGVVKVLDMGLARFEQDPLNDESLTKSNQIMGTVDYMSPEQAADMKSVDERSDIYSLGCTLFFLTTGRPPYYQCGKTSLERLIAHRESPVPSIRDINPNVSTQLDALTTRLLAKEPEERLPTMDAVVAALESLEDPSLDPTRSISLTDTKPIKRAGRPNLKLVVGILLLITAVASAVFLIQQNGQKKQARQNDDPQKQDEPKRGGPFQWKDGRANILTSLHLGRDSNQRQKKGKPHFIQDTLIIPPNAQVMCRYPFPDHYRVELIVERKPPVPEALTVILTGPNSLFGLVTGADTGDGFESCLQPFDGTQRYRDEQAIVKDPIIVDDQKVKLHITVQPTGVTVLADDRKVLDWKDGFENFKKTHSQVKSIVFSSNHTEWWIHEAYVVDLTEQK